MIFQMENTIRVHEHPIGLRLQKTKTNCLTNRNLLSNPTVQLCIYRRVWGHSKLLFLRLCTEALLTHGLNMVNSAHSKK